MQTKSDEILKKLEVSSSKEEKAEVLNWFTTNQGSSFLSDQIDKELNELENLPPEIFVSHSIPSESMRKELLNRVSAKRKNTHSLIYWRAAAIIIPIIMLISFTLYLNQYVDIFGTSTEQTLKVNRGEKLNFIFQDGSKVLANSDTEVTVPSQFGLKNRTVQLRGEAYFEVAKMEKRPFIVQLENAKVEVCGTSFNIKAYPEDDSIRVTLDNGSIAFQNGLNKAETLMQPGQTIAFNKQNGGYRLYAENNKNHAVWTENKIVFQNTPFSEIMRSLERSYDVSFVVKNEAALQYSFTFNSTPNVQLETILNDFERVSPLKFSVSNGIITVL